VFVVFIYTSCKGGGSTYIRTVVINLVLYQGNRKGLQEQIIVCLSGAYLHFAAIMKLCFGKVIGEQFSKRNHQSS
jgi:hypothetical protein